MTLMDELKDLGLTAAAKELTEKERKIAAWADAYAGYAFLTPEQLQAFRNRCGQEWKNGQQKRLRIRALKDYPGIPPAEVRAALRQAKERKLFDTFEVADIEWVTPTPDPILFGRIKDCPDSFVIAQWGEDVSVEEMLEAGKG